MEHPEPLALRCAVLTVSNSRGPEQDSSGDLLVALLQRAGHRVVRRAIVPDDLYRLRLAFSELIADEQVQVVISSGGTGFAGHNTVPDAVHPLFDQPIPGFGELFRMMSLVDIGSAGVQSRALAGVANRTLVFCLPGSNGACRLAWDNILAEQLDSRHRPCNFATQFLAA